MKRSERLPTFARAVEIVNFHMRVAISRGKFTRDGMRQVSNALIRLNADVDRLSRKQGRKVLTIKEGNEVRWLAKSGVGASQLARNFGVCRQTIYNTIRRYSR